MRIVTQNYGVAEKNGINGIRREVRGIRLFPGNSVNQKRDDSLKSWSRRTLLFSEDVRPVVSYKQARNRYSIRLIKKDTTKFCFC